MSMTWENEERIRVALEKIADNLERLTKAIESLEQMYRKEGWITRGEL